jgi:hypothetical protein
MYRERQKKSMKSYLEDRFNFTDYGACPSEDIMNSILCITDAGAVRESVPPVWMRFTRPWSDPRTGSCVGEKGCSFPTTDCELCKDDGEWGMSPNSSFALNHDLSNADAELELYLEHSNLVCLRGCYECVKQNGWKWGKYKETSLDGIEVEVDIPCNGMMHRTGRRPIQQEHTNGELVLQILSDIWDSYTDSCPPHWSYFFEKSPERLHKLICKGLDFKVNPDIAKDWLMEPGQPVAFEEEMIRQSRVASTCTEARAVAERAAVEEHEDPNSPFNSLAAWRASEREWRTRIGWLIPRQLEESFEEEPEYELVSSEEEEMEEDTVIKDHCKKGLELLETMNETGYNEEMYRQLANTFMKIHQNK